MKISVNYPKRFKKLPQKVLVTANKHFSSFFIRNSTRKGFMYQTQIRGIIGLWKKRTNYYSSTGLPSFVPFSHSIIKLIASKMPMVCIPMRSMALISCWVILGVHPTNPCPQNLMQKDHPSDGDVCRLQRGPCKTPDEFRAVSVSN